MNAAQRVSAGEQGGSYQESGPPVAYSGTSHKFLVAWRTQGYGILARFIGTNGVPLGSDFALENPGGSRDPGLAWNPATDEFGLITTGFTSTNAYAAFRRVRASDGAVSARTTFGVAGGTFATDIAVNSANQYIVVWALHPGTMSATFNQAGSLLGSRLVNGHIGYDQAMGLAYNAASGTFLAVSNMSSTLEVGAVEMNATGVPDSGLLTATNGAAHGTFYPRVASSGNVWDIVYSRDFAGPTDQIIKTTSTGGGTSGTTTGTTSGGGGSTCTTVQPGANWVCVNGGWIPGTTGGTTSGGCTTASPGTGWTCVNGGWVPPTTTGGGSTSTCTSMKPGANWVCVNGGWIPGGTSTTSGCTTSSPGTGWTCVNGGWIPPTTTGGGSTSTCTSMKPGANWVCVNGGWIPGTTTTSSCTTASPGTGWTCVNGGWLPPTTSDTSGSTCKTVKPGTNWTCVNGGWIPN